MTQFSEGTELTWHFAMLEVAATMHDTLQPGHFLIALCRISDMPLEVVLADIPRHLDDKSVKARAEIETIKTVFRDVGLNPAQCRPLIRATLGSPGTRPQDGIIHRDEESRRLCAQAELYSQSVGAGEVAPVHLLWALAAMENPPWSGIYSQIGVSPEILRARAEEGARLSDAMKDRT